MYYGILSSRVIGGSDHVTVEKDQTEGISHSPLSNGSLRLQTQMVGFYGNHCFQWRLTAFNSHINQEKISPNYCLTKKKICPTKRFCLSREDQKNFLEEGPRYIFFRFSNINFPHYYLQCTTVYFPAEISLALIT